METHHYTHEQVNDIMLTMLRAPLDREDVSGLLHDVEYRYSDKYLTADDLKVIETMLWKKPCRRWALFGLFAESLKDLKP